MIIKRNKYSFVIVIAVLMVQLLYLEICLATDINCIRIQDGGVFPNGVIAGDAPANALGGGNIDDVVGYAAQVLSAQLRDTHNLTIYYGWGPRPDLAAHFLLSQGGTPNREASGMIVFDNDGTSLFYITAEPDNQGFEYTDYDKTQQDLGSGNIINDSKVHSNANTGPALNGTDLLSVSLHEIGHALGLSVNNNAFVDEAGIDIDVDITTPRPFSGSTIPIQASNSAHLSGTTFTNALMVPTIGTGIRRMPSAADILANAEISKFVNPVLDLIDNSITRSAHTLTNDVCTSNFVNETVTVGDNIYLIKCLPSRFISRGPIEPIPSQWKPGLMIRIEVDGANFPIEINVTDYDTYTAWKMGEIGPDNINGELSVVRDRRIHVLSGGWIGRPKQSLWRIDPLTGNMAHIADL